MASGLTRTRMPSWPENALVQPASSSGSAAARSLGTVTPRFFVAFIVFVLSMSLPSRAAAVTHQQGKAGANGGFRRIGGGALMVLSLIERTLGDPESTTIAGRPA